MSANAPISPPLRNKALPAAGNTAAAPKRLKIMTWNVAALRTIPSKLSTSEFQNTVKMNDTLAAFFKKYEVDIACIQEHKFSGWDKLDKEYACIEGYDSFWSFSGSGYAGVVTYARTGLTKSFTDSPFAAESENKDISELSKGRCMLTDHGAFMILNIYAPNAGRGDEYLERKMAFYGELSRAMARWTEAGHKVVITGDINTAHSEFDIYNPRKYIKDTGFLESEREWITTFLSQRKCKDVWREFNPGVRKYTFWDQKRLMREKNCGWRIDVFYANESLMEDVLSSEILDNVMGSDHCPITLTLKDTVSTSHPTPQGAGNIRKATNQPTLKSFFQAGVKRGHAGEEPISKPTPSRTEDRTHGKIIKAENSRKRFKGDESSQGSEDSAHDEILERVFGVTKEQDKDAQLLAQHRKKELEWRKEHET